MTVERHLILQEMTLRPSGEWTPQHRGWMVVRVAEGVGYWLHNGNARELNVGDGFVVALQQQRAIAVEPARPAQAPVLLLVQPAFSKPVS